jgi:hypothetical protein
MSGSDEGKKARAASASGEELAALLHDPSPEIVKAILANSNLSDEDVLVIVNRKNMPAHLLDMIARDERWKDSYPVRLALAKNPKTPLSVSLSIVRYLHIFDIAEMTRSHLIPLAFRHKVESIVMERIPTMPLGNKKSLAKMAVGNVLFRLLQDADAEVVALCLDNPRMPESHLFKLISRKDTPAETIRMIAGHRSWSVRPLVRYALVRNEHASLAVSERFLRAMKVTELRELYADPTLPPGVKPLVYRELIGRNEEPKEQIDEPVFEIGEYDDEGLDDFKYDEERENRDESRDGEGEQEDELRPPADHV